MQMLRQIAFAMFTLLAAVSARADHVNIRPFDADSMAAIRAQHAGKAFVIAFWSTGCEPCRKEMTVWRGLKLRYPKMPVLLVSADAPGEQAAVRAFIAHYNPGPVQHWMFADEFAERVRYSIDKSWRGELPRTYFFDAAHNAEPVSGLIDKRMAEQWFKRHLPPR